jgi:serine/threonine protein phosphatase PrpC
MTLASTARTHVGHVRVLNEDRFLDRPEAGLFAVVDGMGGHRGGDQAAQSVVDALRQLGNAREDVSPDKVIAALTHANRLIHQRNMATGEQAGATVVAAHVEGDTMHLAWVGDSRCYHIGRGAVRQLTRDHSVVQELVDAGLLTPSGAERHPQANVVTRALGIGALCEVETRRVPISLDDRILLCSDGLSRSLRPADLTDAPLEVLANMLLDQALARDGSDNISLVLIEAHRGHERDGRQAGGTRNDHNTAR